MTWLTDILKAQLKEQLAIKYYVISDVAENPKYDGYQMGLTSTVYKFFDIKTFGDAVKNDKMTNKESAEELHKPIIRKSEKRIGYLPFIDNVWGANLPDMQLVGKFNKGVLFLLCIIDILQILILFKNS